MKKTLLLTLYCLLIHLPWLGLVFGGVLHSPVDRLKDGLNRTFDLGSLAFMTGPYLIGLATGIFLVLVRKLPNNGILSRIPITLKVWAIAFSVAFFIHLLTLSILFSGSLDQKHTVFYFLPIVVSVSAASSLPPLFIFSFTWNRIPRFFRQTKN
jgi:hypothetical protein